jgi:hypothetical protein
MRVQPSLIERDVITQEKSMISNEKSIIYRDIKSLITRDVNPGL